VVDELTTRELIIIAPRPAEQIRQRSRAAEHRAVGRVRHRPAVRKGRAGAVAGGSAAPAR